MFLAPQTAAVRRRAEAPAGETALGRFTRTLPNHVLASNMLSAGAYRVEKFAASKMAEIAPDPEGWQTAIRCDVDYDGAGAAWIEAGLPAPNLVVVNPRNGHAHLIWLLHRWVRLSNDRERNYAIAVQRGLTEALHGDRAYHGRFHHNPISSHYVTRSARAEPYTLGELAQYLDLYDSEPRKHFRPAPVLTREGRNNDVFHRTRLWSYGAVQRYRSAGIAAWEAAVLEQVAIVNASVANDYPSRGPLDEREQRSIAKSISRFAWNRYTGKQSAVVAAAEAILRRERARLRAAKAREERGCEKREAYIGRAAQRRADAIRLANQQWTTDQIAAALGCSARTVRGYLAGSRQSPCAASEYGARGGCPEAAVGVSGSERKQSEEPQTAFSRKLAAKSLRTVAFRNPQSLLTGELKTLRFVAAVHDAVQAIQRPQGAPQPAPRSLRETA